MADVSTARFCGRDREAPVDVRMSELLSDGNVTEDDDVEVCGAAFPFVCELYYWEVGSQ